MSDTVIDPVKPVMLCVLDGWGWRADREANAAAMAKTPVWDRLWNGSARAFLKTSGSAVGLPDGQMGNSEVGHMNLGAGRVVMQDLPRIDRAIADDQLLDQPELVNFVQRMKASGGRVHLMGLLSPGGVHSHQAHMIALARLCDAAGLNMCIHAFTDGRDTAPKSALQFVADVQAALPRGVRLATINGRYFAMDRDKRWERIERAFNAMVHAKSEWAAPTAISAIETAYGRGESDEFIQPTIVGDYAGFRAGDGLLMANFRADRARQILTALTDPGFQKFETAMEDLAACLGMVEYSDHLNAHIPAIFPKQSLQNGFGEVVAAAGKTQLRLAETEKYPHVTFFFNGGAEAEVPGEQRIMIPSPKVATYDLQPEMSADGVTDALVAAIDSGDVDVIVVNYANPDMVGHTGSIPAAIKAVETVDACLGRALAALQKVGGAGLVTADHGNVELMVDPETGNPHTAHTTFDVPAFLVGAAPQTGLSDGALCDVAPTLLALMGLAQPAEMTGRSLLTSRRRSAA